MPIENSQQGLCQCPHCDGLNTFRSPFMYRLGQFVLGHGCRHCDRFSVGSQKVVQLLSHDVDLDDRDVVSKLVKSNGST